MVRIANTIEAIKRNAIEHPYLLVFIVAMIVRLLNVTHISFSGGSFMAEDSGLYTVIAPEWMKSLGLLSGEPRAIGYDERTPLYPILIGTLQILGLGQPLFFVLANAIFDAVTCVLIATLGAMLRYWTGLAAGLLAALWPNLVIQSGLVLTDSLFVLLLTGVYVSVAHFIRDPSAKLAGVTGVLLGLAILTRTVAQLLPVPVFLVLLIAARRSGCSWRQAIFTSSAQLIAIAFLIVPIQMHNHERFGSYSLTSQTGTHLLLWIVPAVHEAEHGTPKDKTAEQMHERLNARLAEMGKTRDQLTSFEISHEQTQLAVELLKDTSAMAMAKAWLNGFVLNLATPAVLADLRVRALSNKSFYAIEDTGILNKVQQYLGGSGPVYTTIFVVGGIGSVLTLIGSSIGFFALARRHIWIALIAFLIVLYFLMINGPVASPKYRLPFEPIMILLTVLGAIFFWKKVLVQRRNPRDEQYLN